MNIIKKLQNKVQAKITGMYLSYRYDQRAKQTTRKVYVNESYSDETVKVVHTAVKIMAVVYAVRKLIAYIRKAIKPNVLGLKHTRVIRHIFFHVSVKEYAGYTDGEPNGAIQTVITYKPRRWTTPRFVYTIRLLAARLIVAVYIVYLMSALFPVNPEASY